MNLRRDCFECDGIRIVESTGALISGAIAVTRELDLRGLQEQIQAAERNVESDPTGSIGDAKELLQSVFRTIASHHGISVDPNADMTEMFNSIRDVLIVVPNGVTNPGEADAILRRLLGNLSGLCDSMTGLRRAYGSGHWEANRIRWSEGNSRARLPRSSIHSQNRSETF